jgi:hypothetical protein
MTCPLCGTKQHSGPCYADWREQWREDEYKRKLICDVAEFNLNKWSMEQLLKQAEGEFGG